MRANVLGGVDIGVRRSIASGDAARLVCEAAESGLALVGRAAEAGIADIVVAALLLAGGAPTLAARVALGTKPRIGILAAKIIGRGAVAAVVRAARVVFRGVAARVDARLLSRKARLTKHAKRARKAHDHHQRGNEGARVHRSHTRAEARPASCAGRHHDSKKKKTSEGGVLT